MFIQNKTQLPSSQVFHTISDLFNSFLSSNSTENNYAWISEDLMRIYTDYVYTYKLALKQACV